MVSAATALQTPLLPTMDQSASATRITSGTQIAERVIALCAEQTLITSISTASICASAMMMPTLTTRVSASSFLSALSMLSLISRPKSVCAPVPMRISLMENAGPVEISKSSMESTANASMAILWELRDASPSAVKA